MNKFFESLALRKEAARGLNMLARHIKAVNDVKRGSIAASSEYYRELAEAMARRVNASRSRALAKLQNPKTLKEGLAGLRKADVAANKTRLRNIELSRLADSFDAALVPHSSRAGSRIIDPIKVYDLTRTTFGGPDRPLDSMNILNRFVK